MSTRLQVERPQSSRLPPLSGLAIQAKCACNGSAGLAGKCEDCNRQGLSIQRSSRSLEQPGSGVFGNTSPRSTEKPSAHGSARFQGLPPIQRQASTEPPADHLEEEPTDDRPQAAAPEEFEDTGEGVASIERGSAGPSPEAGEEDRPVQTKEAVPSSVPGRTLATTPILHSLQNGEALDAGARSGMERFFGQDLGGIRIHTDRRAQALASSLGADAFTIGHQIAFSAGKYQPHTTEGRKLLAHELTHVVQQRRGLFGEILQSGIGRVGDRYEVEADEVAERIARSWTTPRMARAVQPSSFSPSVSQPVINRRAIQLFSGSKAASYARTWATSRNPDYVDFENDCTNFASQAMNAGGWPMRTGGVQDICDKRKDNDVWWYLKHGCDPGWLRSYVNASHTWGGAENFFQFVIASGRGTPAAEVRNLSEGDVLQIDYHASGHRGHTMVVTGKSNTNLYLSYHSSDHLDEPFWREGVNEGIRDRVASNYPKAAYYAWKMK